MEGLASRCVTLYVADLDTDIVDNIATGHGHEMLWSCHGQCGISLADKFVLYNVRHNVISVVFPFCYAVCAI